VSGEHWHGEDSGAGLDEEEQEEVSALARRLAVRPWQVGGRDDTVIEAVHRHAHGLRRALARVGWSLTVEPDLVRVHKPAGLAASPVPGEASAAGTWFWLTVAALESLRPRVGLGQVVAAARAAAAEATIAVTQSPTELRALVAALGMLRERGLLEELEGHIEALLDQEDPPVLLRVHHVRLLHVVPRGVPLNECGQWSTDPATDPGQWLAGLERPEDLSVRMCGMLADQAVVHTCDLSDDERQWFSDRLPREGTAAAEAFGLTLERRVEGAAFVMPAASYAGEWELGPFVFPRRQRGGTVVHAALLLIDHLTQVGDRGAAMAPGPGWYGAGAGEVVGRLGELAAQYTGWAGEYRSDPSRLAEHVRALLEPPGLLRVVGGYEDQWWLSPAVARWTVVAHEPGQDVTAHHVMETAR
jgi:uncharacterized protein (TIGR02678 family)